LTNFPPGATFVPEEEEAMARSRREGRSRGGGGAGQIVTVLIVVGLLGGLAWFGWSRIQAANRTPETPSGPRVTILTIQRLYRLKGDVPDPLPENWRLSFTVPPFVRRAGESTVYPRAWMDVQMEGGKITGMTLAVWRHAKLTAPFDVICHEAFAGEREGQQLREHINKLADMPDKSNIEKETANFRIFAWKNQGAKSVRRSLVCVVRKTGAESSKMYQKAKTDWRLGIAGGSTAPTGPRTKFDVLLVSFDKKDRDRVIAAVCEVTGLGPAEGGTLADSAPKPVKLEATREEAEAIKRKLEAAGAKVRIK
jgi:ribosomal protein L7/L12